MQVNGGSCIFYGSVSGSGSVRQLCDVCERQEGQWAKEPMVEQERQDNTGEKAGRTEARESTRMMMEVAVRVKQLLLQLAPHEVCGLCFLTSRDSYYHVCTAGVCPVLDKSMCYSCAAVGSCRGGSCGVRDGVKLMRTQAQLCSRCVLPAVAGMVELHESSRMVNGCSERGSGSCSYLMHTNCSNGGGRYMWLALMRLYHAADLRHSILTRFFNDTSTPPSIRPRTGDPPALASQHAWAQWLVSCNPGYPCLPNLAWVLAFVAGTREAVICS
jgi:hypothetical protein